MTEKAKTAARVALSQGTFITELPEPGSPQQPAVTLSSCWSGLSPREFFFQYLCSAAGNCLPQRHKSKSGCLWSTVPQQLCCLWKQRLLFREFTQQALQCQRHPSISATVLFVGILLIYTHTHIYKNITKYCPCNIPLWSNETVPESRINYMLLHLNNIIPF